MKRLFTTKCVWMSKKVKNGYFVQFQRKKMYIVLIFLFCSLFRWKETFFLKWNIFLFSELKKKMVFLGWDGNSPPKNSKKGIIYAILREKNELPWIVLTFSFILIENMEMKRKNTEKSFFLKKYIFFSLKWLVLHFM